MPQTNVDANRVIEALSAQLAQANLNNTILQLQLSDAQTALTTHTCSTGDGAAPDGA